MAKAAKIKAFDDWRPQGFLPWSLLGHGGLIFIVFLACHWATPPAPLEHVLPTAVRVDLVAMPKLTLKELKNLDINLTSSGKSLGQKSLAPPPPTSDDPQAYQVAAKKSRQDFKAMLQAEAQKAQGQVAQAKAVSDAQAKKHLADLALAGNILAKGNALTGESQQAEVSAINAYAGQVRDLVRAYWRLPSYLQDKNLRCVVHIFINAQGTLLKARVAASSHNAEFDRWALTAAQQTSYPAPPEEAKNSIIRHGLKLVFPL
jgi:TonB family protein